VRWDLEDPETGRLIARVETQIFSLLYLEDQEKVVVGNMNGGVHWVDLRDPDKTKNIAHHQKGVFDIRRIGEYVYTLGGEGMLTRWSATGLRSVESYQLTNKPLRSMDYNPERNEIAVGASDNAIYFLDAETLEIRYTQREAHDNSVFTVSYAPDGRHLLSGGRDAHLKVWNLDNGAELVCTQPAHWFTINDLAFHPSGKWFATGSRDKTIKIWEAESWQLLKVLDAARNGGHINSVNGLFWSSHRNWLISCSDDRSMIVWEVEML
jgi:WD40 repeat protein